MSSSILPPEGEHLATGWEPDLPADDSLVRQAVLAHASWAVAAARRADRPWYDDATWSGGILGDRGPITNWIIPKQPVPTQDVIAAVDRELPRDVPYLFVSPWPTPDLTPYGLALAGHPPLMMHFPNTPTAPLTTTLEIRQVTTPEELADAEQVLVNGYPLPELQPYHQGDLYSPTFLAGDTAAWVAYDGPTPVATSVAHHAHGMTVVENVAALPQARGRGAGAAITWAATTHHLTHPATLIASDAGQPIYQRLDYVRLERWTVWVRP
ncbi:hypothetical protein [Kribbella sp. NPDC051770]|uniref:hypothetical protein n=1 Tax=Kribbella sp. NPDC051770 TaxID=3155413 RepID=UPI0034205620